MAMRNPQGRANYEPNSWGAEGGPRESPERGFRSFAGEENGTKQRVRSESFADHYSQARQFYISQTDVEQAHMAAALVFELSKVQRPEIRARMVSHLLNIHEDLANEVVDGLGLSEVPAAADAARPTRKDLKESPALSILRNGPESFAGRKVGALVTDGSDAVLLSALRDAVKSAGATLELIAPKVGGITASDGSEHAANEKVGGGPSVLYDAVVVMPSKDGAEMLAGEAAAREFLVDAHAHCKFVGYVEEADGLVEASGLADKMDEGWVDLGLKNGCKSFVKKCCKLRYWQRVD